MVQTYHYNRGGDSTHMFNLTRLLEENGHEVIPFAMKHPKNLESPWSDYFTSEIDFPKLLEERSAKSAFEVVSKSIYNREAKQAIDRLIEEVRPDLAHFHNIHGHLTTSILGPLTKRNIPIVWTLHDYRMVCPNTSFLCGNEICEKCLPRNYYNAVLRKCKKGNLGASAIAMATSYFDRFSRVPQRVAKFITPSAFLKTKLVEGKIDPAKVDVIPNFVDVKSFNTGKEGDYFLYFGRLSYEKGVDLLIKGVSEMKSEKATGSGAPMKLKVVGEGPSMDELKKLVLDTGAPVEFLGFRTGDDLRNLLEETQFVVVPSRCYENLPFSVMEAMAAGKPLLASDIGGIPEMVENNVTGILFSNGNMDELKTGIEKLLYDANLRAKMSVAGRQKAERLFDRAAHYKKVMEVYDGLLEK